MNKPFGVYRVYKFKIAGNVVEFSTGWILKCL